jgi:hypothetical protein
MRKEYIILLAGNLKEIPFWRPSYRFDNNIKMVFKEIGELIYLAQDKE